MVSVDVKHHVYLLTYFVPQVAWAQISQAEVQTGRGLWQVSEFLDIHTLPTAQDQLWIIKSHIYIYSTQGQNISHKNTSKKVAHSSRHISKRNQVKTVNN